MSIFDYRKPASEHPTRDVIGTLRTTMERLEAEPEETPRIADLKRILGERIEEIERITR